MKDGKFHIGDTPIKIKGDDITVGDKEFKGTEGLWELIMSKKPDESKFTDRDYENYTRLLFDTNAIFRNNDPNTNRPKASGGYKWKEIVGPIWEAMAGKTGSGLSDPNTLLERLDLLMESKKAGNTGVGRELVSICDELKN